MITTECFEKHLSGVYFFPLGQIWLITHWVPLKVCIDLEQCLVNVEIQTRPRLIFPDIAYKWLILHINSCWEKGVLVL